MRDPAVKEDALVKGDALKEISNLWSRGTLGIAVELCPYAAPGSRGTVVAAAAGAGIGRGQGALRLRRFVALGLNGDESELLKGVPLSAILIPRYA